jgi:hypothetical protein
LQTAGRLSPPVSGTFPLALVLQAAESAAHATGIWQPDWPFQLPPDAFRVNSGDIARITLAGDGIYLVLSHDEKGRPVDFPFMLNGNLAQVGITFHNGEIYRMTVSFPPSKDAWELEFLDHDGSYYALVRVFAGNTWYFIRLSRWVAGITELWFDVEGTLLGGYSYALATVGTTQKIRSIRDFLNPDAPGMDSYFDSWGLPTRISGPGGLHTVLRYRDALPRFWERQTPSGTGHFYLQWDANDLLFRMAPQSAGATAGQPAEYRFEYTLDERGNWIQRRELRMFPHSGYLFPAPGAVFQRTLEYRHP